MNTTALREERMQKWKSIANSGSPTVFYPFVLSFILTLLTLLYRTVATRLFKPYSIIIFGLLDESRRGWQTDQLRVAIVNIGGPISALACGPVYRTIFGGLWSNSVRRPLERCMALLWWIGAVIFSLLPLIVPFAMGAIPTVPGVPGSPDDCAASLSWDSKTNSVLQLRYSNAIATDMLRDVDGRYNFSGTTVQSVGLTPNDRVSVAAECPDWAAVCERNNSLRVDVDYRLKPSELNIGPDKGLEGVEFGVMNTCYKVENRVKLLNNDSMDGLTYGAMYGSSFDPDNLPGVTDTFYTQEFYGSGYRVASFFNSSGITSPIGWQPNDTLLHDGDRTLLVYHLMGVKSAGPTTDPLFTTMGEPSTSSGILDLYLSRRFIVPIMCNTTYSICNTTDTGKSCRLFSGAMAVANHIDEMDSPSMSKGFLELMRAEVTVPLLQVLAGTADSVLASQSLSQGSVQTAPGEISGHAEIMRLALAARMKLVTSATRAASNWVYYAPRGTKPTLNQSPSLRTLCRATFIEDASRITAPLVPLLVIFIAGIIAILLTVTGPIWRLILWKQLSVLTIRWRLRTVGQLHRGAVEGGNPDKFWPRGCLDTWPEGKGETDMVGLVDWKGGYHAGYRWDAKLKHVPRELTNIDDD